MKTIKIAGYTIIFKSYLGGYNVYIKRGTEKSPFIGSCFANLLNGEQWAVAKIWGEIKPQATELGFIDNKQLHTNN